MKKGEKMSDEQKQILSDTHKGKNHPFYGKHHTEETKKKMSISKTGLHHSEKSKKKMSESKNGKNNPMFGKHMSKEAKLKISIANKGCKRSVEFIKKYLIGKNNPMFGKHPSKETRKKLSDNNARYWLGKKKPPLSKETRKKLSESLSGKNHWNWKGGNTTENAKIRESLEYKLWREAVFARDNWTCQKSNVRGGKLEAHHINNFSDYPELRFAIDNGITFSKKEHKKFHRKYGIKNNNQKQIKEFLNNK